MFPCFNPTNEGVVETTTLSNRKKVDSGIKKLTPVSSLRKEVKHRGTELQYYRGTIIIVDPLRRQRRLTKGI